MRGVFAGLAGVLGALAVAGVAQAGACKVAVLASLPVTMVDDAPVMPAVINGQQVRFIADSGAFFSVITPASASALKLSLGPAPFGLMMDGVGGLAGVSLATVRSFGIAGADLKDIQFLVGGSDVGQGRTVGVIGENVLGVRDAEYDLAHGVIRLMDARGCWRSNLAYWSKDGSYDVLDIEARDPRAQPMIRGAVSVNGKRLQAIFDTGAWSSVLSLGAARRAGIQPDGPGVRFAGYGSGFGRRRVKSWIAPIDSFAIGAEQVNHTHIRIGELPDGMDMLVGADFFLSHRIFVSNSTRQLFFSYNGGPVFDLSTKLDPAGEGDGTGAPVPPAQATAAAKPDAPAQGGAAPADADAPTDADGYARRGAAFAARRADAQALADDDKAVALAPGEPRYLYQRALLRMAQHQPLLAMGDLDAALKLKPDDAEIRLQRAALRLHGDDRPGALADVDDAAAAAPKPSDLRLRMGELYLEMDRFAPAVEQFDLWTRDHGDDSRLPLALNGRCWARALGDLQLDKALSDCNAAVRLTHAGAEALDSRALAHLRRGEDAAALADYDAALAKNPRIAWSLYGRGLLEAKAGQAEKARADIAAAAAIAPKLLARAKAAGLAAPSQAAPPAPVATR